MGVWSLVVPAANPEHNALHLARAPISFLIPLATEPTAHYLKNCESLPVEEEVEPGVVIHPQAECEVEQESVKEEFCPGSFEAPTAEPGQLCVYSESEEYGAPQIGVITHKFGAQVAANFGEPGGFASGSWAVTAE